MWYYFLFANTNYTFSGRPICLWPREAHSAQRAVSTGPPPRAVSTGPPRAVASAPPARAVSISPPPRVVASAPPACAVIARAPHPRVPRPPLLHQLSLQSATISLPTAPLPPLRLSVSMMRINVGATYTELVSPRARVRGKRERERGRRRHRACGRYAPLLVVKIGQCSSHPQRNIKPLLRSKQYF
jgi:hypothetical protein